MFDGKIDFMDFNKIKINYGGKLTCRKIFKKKYIIFLIASVIILIVLISLYTVKNNNIITTQVDIKNFEERKSKLDSNYILVKNKNQEEEMNLNQYKNQINTIRKEISEIKSKEEKIKKENLNIKTQRDDLEKKSTSLSIELKTQYELKEVNEKKLSSLTVLLDNLKIEYNKLVEQKGGEKEGIEVSKIISPLEAFGIEKKIKGSIGEKCFDGQENNYDPKLFHENCDKSPLLILIKTEDDSRLGAFIKVSSEGFEIKKDFDSALINIDAGKYFYVGSKDYTTIICDPNELPQIGLDLQIKKNGEGVNLFPFHYGKKTDSNQEFYGKNNFKIKNLEIFKVKF